MIGRLRLYGLKLIVCERFSMSVVPDHLFDRKNEEALLPTNPKQKLEQSQC
jgi:hypothetical protein